MESNQLSETWQKTTTTLKESETITLIAAIELTLTMIEINLEKMTMMELNLMEEKI